MKTVFVLNILLIWQQVTCNYGFRIASPDLSTVVSPEAIQECKQSGKWTLTRALFETSDLKPRDYQLSHEEVYDFFHSVIGFDVTRSLDITKHFFQEQNITNESFQEGQETLDFKDACAALGRVYNRLFTF